MGLFSRWTSPPPDGPRTVGIEPGLSMSVVPRELDGRPVRTYRSAGLQARGQREIAVHVVRRDGEAPDALDVPFAMLYRTIGKLAGEGRVVSEGGITELGGNGFLAPHLGGLLYTAPEPEHHDELGALVLVREELHLVRTSHAMRVLARLGQAYRHFPFPRFSDRDRPSVVSPADAASVVTRMPRATIPETSLLVRGDTFELRLGPRARATLEKALAKLPVETAFALVTEPDPRANGWLVWSPGQTAPSAITPPGSGGERLTGGFLAVVPEQATDEVRLHEDGAAAMVRTTTARAMRDAMARGAALDVGATGGTSLSIRHV